MTTTDERLAEIRARLAAATVGPWVVRRDQSNGEGSTELVIASDSGTWHDCGYYCFGWDEKDLTHRGEPGMAHKHEHKSDPTVISGSGWHGSGDLIVSDEDAEFIARAREDIPFLLSLLDEVSRPS